MAWFKNESEKERLIQDLWRLFHSDRREFERVVARLDPEIKDLIGAELSRRRR